MTCLKCGAVSAQGALACAACGAPLQATRAPEPTALQRTRPTGVTLIAAADFVAAGVTLVGAFAALMFFTFLGAAFSIFTAGAALPFFASIGMALVLAALAIAAGLIVLGIGLLRGSDAARIIQLCVAGLVVLGSLGGLAATATGDLDLAGGVPQLAWGIGAGFAIWYLLQADAKAWFQAS